MAVTTGSVMTDANFGITDWVNLTLVNSWVLMPAIEGWQSPQYRRHGDHIELRGSCRSGTSGSDIATLPTGFRPASLVRFLVPHSSTTAKSVLVRATGAINSGTADGGDGVTLDGIIFSTAP